MLCAAHAVCFNSELLVPRGSLLNFVDSAATQAKFATAEPLQMLFRGSIEEEAISYKTFFAFLPLEI